MTLTRTQTDQKETLFSYHYFISYSTKDTEFAEVLDRRLFRKSRSCWFDKESLRGSEHFPRGIEIGIERCRQMIVLVSEHSMKSDWVYHEAWSILSDDPINRSGRLIPVRLDDEPLIPTFKNLQMIDATNGIDSDVISKILAVPCLNN